MSSESTTKKPNRAKARLQKRAQMMEQQRAEAAAEASFMPDKKAEEERKMASKLADLQLREQSIKADGNCLYSAIAHQLSSQGIVEQHANLRTCAAQYIRQHPDDFAPFLETDKSPSGSLVDDYANEVENTARWGGEVEIIALARHFGVNINVIQAQQETLKFEEQNTSRLYLSRYQHLYSLGAHFNSLILDEREGA